MVSAPLMHSLACRQQPDGRGAGPSSCHPPLPVGGSLIVMVSANQTTVIQAQLQQPARIFECSQMNGTRMVAVTFDASRGFRAYGVVDRGGGELLSLVVPHDTRMSVCKVRSEG